MKKVLICLAACFSCLMVNAQTTPTISVSDVYATPGGSFTFTTNLTNGRVGVYENFEFKIVLPDGFTTDQTSGSTNWEGASKPEVGPAAAGMMSSNFLQYADQDNIMSVTINVDESVIEGTYQITLNNILLGYNKVYQDYPDDVTFNVFVTDVLTLDENSQVAPKATTATGNVKVIRTLKKDEWSTICLPINITAAKLQAALGNYQLAELSSVKSTKDGDAVQSIDVVFTDVASTGRLVANHPYIIKVENDIESFEVESVRVSETPADLSQKSAQEYDEENDIDYYPWIFTGTHVAKTIVPKNSLFLSDNQFYYSAGKTKMKAFRGYFTFNDILSSLDDASSRVKIFVTNGDETTEIQIPELLNDGEYYNLNGLRVDTPSKGVYIKDGKKVVVK